MEKRQPLYFVFLFGIIHNLYMSYKISVSLWWKDYIIHAFVFIIVSLQTCIRNLICVSLTDIEHNNLKLISIWFQLMESRRKIGKPCLLFLSYTKVLSKRIFMATLWKVFHCKICISIIRNIWLHFLSFVDRRLWLEKEESMRLFSFLTLLTSLEGSKNLKFSNLLEGFIELS